MKRHTRQQFRNITARGVGFASAAFTRAWMAVAIFHTVMSIAPICLAQFPGQKTYCNPLDLDYKYNFQRMNEGISYRSGADPVIINHGGEYYLFVTVSGGYWHSKDLLHWRFVTPRRWLPVSAPTTIVSDSLRTGVFCATKVFMRVLREKIQPPSGHSFRVIRWSRDVSEVEVVLAGGKTAKIIGEGTHWHYHVEMELTLFTAGRGTRFVGDHIGSFGAGDLILLGEKLPHYWHTDGSSAGLSVQWHFPESHPFWGFPEMLSFLPLFKSAGRGLRFTGRTASAAAVGLHDITRTDGAERLALLLHLLALMAAAPAHERGFLSAGSFALPTESQYQEAIREAMRHLIARFRDEVRLEEILQITGLSRPTFARQFKKHSGRTFSEFLNHLRLQAACRELAESQRSVLEIALDSGFTQVSFFNRVFRRMLKCSPTAYRAKHWKRTSDG